MGKSDRTADLLKILSQKPPVEVAWPAKPPLLPAPAGRTAGRRKSKPSTAPAHAKIQPTRGRAIQFYLHPEDEKLIRELTVWLATHRKRINDSLVIKSALRAVKTDSALLAAYDDAVKIDGRLSEHRHKVVETE